SSLTDSHGLTDSRCGSMGKRYSSRVKCSRWQPECCSQPAEFRAAMATQPPITQIAPVTEICPAESAAAGHTRCRDRAEFSCQLRRPADSGKVSGTTDCASDC